MQSPIQDLRRATAHLRRADPVLASIIASVGPCAFEIRRGPHFALLARAIVYQQISGKAAASIHERLLSALGRPLRPPSILAASDAVLRGAGLSRQKVVYLRDLATQVQNGIDLKRLGRLGDEEVVATLTAIKGIGRWTAEMFLMFRLGRLDVLPVHDLGIRSAVRRAYRLRKPPNPERLRRLAEPWRPYRTIACWYLWRSLEVRTPGAPA
jgi:DNA-3-methyladenine glycosylase II